jgi:hypothetical protein
MGMNKDMEFDKDYCRLLNMCMNRGGYGAATFFVDMHMSEFTMKSCMNSEAISTKVVTEDYFEQFEIPDLMDMESELDDGDDDE